MNALSSRYSPVVTSTMTPRTRLPFASRSSRASTETVPEGLPETVPNSVYPTVTTDPAAGLKASSLVAGGGDAELPAAGVEPWAHAAATHNGAKRSEARQRKWITRFIRVSPGSEETGEF